MQDTPRPGQEHPVLGRPGTRELALSDLEPGLLEVVHETLLRPAFRPEELLTLSDLQGTYGEPGPDPSLVVLVDETPVAVMLGERYVQQQVLLLSYLAVGTGLRGTGLGAHLLGEVLPGWSVGGAPVLTLAEVDDPRSWPGSEEEGDPRARLRFYERHGGRVLPLRYFQPSIRAGSSRVEGMLLLRLDRSAPLADGLLGRFLEEYFVACEGHESLDDPSVAELVAAADALDLERDAWPLGRWEEVPTA